MVALWRLANIFTPRHFDTQTFWHPGILTPRVFDTQTFCRPDVLPPRHFATPYKVRHFATPVFCHPDVLPLQNFCHSTLIVTQTYCLLHILPLGHLDTQTFFENQASRRRNILCRLFNIEAGYDLCFKFHLISYLSLTILNFTWPNTPGKPK